MLSRSEQARLDALEAELRRTSPALDRALAHGVLHGLPGLPGRRRLAGSRQAWPVAVLAGLGCGLIALGLALPDVVSLVLGFYLVPLSWLGLWLPLLRAPRHAPDCPCSRNQTLVPGHHHRHRRDPGGPPRRGHPP